VRRERRAGEGKEERNRSLGMSKLQREGKKDVNDVSGVNDMVYWERDELEGRVPILSQLQRNVEDRPDYKGDLTPSEGTKGIEISIEKMEEVSRVVTQEAGWVERGEFG
jgi:hypothetical protein